MVDNKEMLDAFKNMFDISDDKNNEEGNDYSSTTDDKSNVFNESFEELVDDVSNTVSLSDSSVKDLG